MAAVFATAVSDVAQVAAASAAVELTLNSEGQQDYEFSHTGLNVSGGADVATAWVGNTAPTADYASRNGQIPIIYGQPPVRVPPGWKTAYLICASGAPVVRVVAGARWNGNF